MPTWSGILKELQQTTVKEGIFAFDIVRRKYLTTLSQVTKRNTILYATNWTTNIGLSIDPGAVSITEHDIQGLMEVMHGLKGEKLDIILHSPGGSAEATEALVSYLRMKFNDIRVIIPQAAMSAATMLACSANTIVMGKHSFMGPIDPQIFLTTQLGPQIIAAQAILDQFQLAKEECKDPNNLNVWYPMLSQFGPALLTTCNNALELSRNLVLEWLVNYMFKDVDGGEQVAKEIAKYLSDHTEFKTHSRHINRDIAKSKGFIIEDLESNQEVQDLVLSVFHATTHTFAATGLTKIIENQLGKTFAISFNPVPPPKTPTTKIPPPNPSQAKQ
jgi:ATP-dependent protease ClpP protease subunit